MPSDAMPSDAMADAMPSDAMSSDAMPEGDVPDGSVSEGASGQSENARNTAARHCILVVEDDDEIRSAACDALEELGYETRAEPSAGHALTSLHQSVPAAIVADVRMPGMTGIEFCQRLTGDWPQVPVVLMTAFGDVDTAVDALRAGAFDFITKPISFDHLANVLERAVARHSAQPAMVRLGDPDVPDGSFEGLVGSSEALRDVLQRITRVAPTSATVLITGESGTGKELVARAVHRTSPRRNGPFVALSCAAMPHELLEAELFGYRRGAFTGASQARDGLFQRADGGTLFLDEIGELPLTLQPKLLRVLEERRVRPLGSPSEIPLDLRIIAATNRNLEQAVAQGQFREDLLFRLNVHHIELPPLRERGSDVLELARYFLARGVATGQSPELTSEAEQLLMSHHWPGNVRELENSLSAAMALAPAGRIGVGELPARLQASAGRASSSEPAEPASLEEVERKHIEIVLRATRWNKALAARKLGIDRATLYRKLMRLGLTEPRR
jgi:two-component system, NtrC family, response regulator AtoC